NFWRMYNSDSGQPVLLSSAGLDSNVSLYIYTKGEGVFNMGSEALTNQFLFGTGAGFNRETIFNFPSTPGSTTITWRAVSGTVALLSDIGGGSVNVSSANNLAYYAASGSTLSGLSSVLSSVLTCSDAGVLSWKTIGQGQFITGATGGSPDVGTIVAGPGIEVSSSVHDITVRSVGFGVSWTPVAVNTTMTSNSGYIATATGVDFLLPSTAAVGSVLAIACSDSVLSWRIIQN